MVSLLPACVVVLAVAVSLTACSDVDAQGEEAEINFSAVPGELLSVKSSTGKFCSGGYYTAAINDDGSVTFWGMIAAGVRSRKPSILALPGSVPAKQLSCGAYHLLILSADGLVFSVGRNDLGQAGVANLKPVEEVTLLSELFGKSIVQLAAGAEHSLAVTSSGDLWGFGSTQMCQLALRSVKLIRNFPIELNEGIPDNIVAACAGGQHSVVLTKDGQLYTWGASAFGQLGREKSSSAEEHSDPVPKRVVGLDGSVQSIYCGGDHTFVVTSKGLYGWGWGELGQLATGSTDDVLVASPVPIPGSASSPASVVSMCGGYGHSAIVVADGAESHVYTSGWNQRGQLGVGDRRDRHVWSLVDGVADAVAVGCGFKHTSILRRSGAVVVGDNTFFQLGYAVVPWPADRIAEYDATSIGGKDYRKSNVQEAAAAAEEEDAAAPSSSEVESTHQQPAHAVDSEDAEVARLMQAFPEYSKETARKLVQHRRTIRPPPGLDVGGADSGFLPEDDSANNINRYRTA